jgi:hypothetical protein
MAQARGPLNLLLSHSGAQWATILGMGAYAMNPESVLQAVRSLTSATVERPMGDRTQPIIIHTGESRNSGNSNNNSLTSGLWTTLIFYTVGAGCVWLSYSVLTSLLPDCVGDFMPVTRRVFDRTTKNLATSLFNVKEAMLQQIQFLMQKQDEFGDKQEETHRDVQDIQEDMKHVRSDLTDVRRGVDRCEATVEASQRLQSYTARGVKLLVAAVATVLPRDDVHILRELEQYARDGEQFRIESSALRMPSSSYASPEPPENEHPRQQSFYNPAAALPAPPAKHSSMTQSPPPMTRDQYDPAAQLDFLAMIRNGTLVVQRP